MLLPQTIRQCWCWYSEYGSLSLGNLFYDAFSVTEASMIGWQVNEHYESTRTNIHDLSGIRTHGLSVRAIKTYGSDRAATGTGCENGHSVCFSETFVFTYLQAHKALQRRTPTSTCSPPWKHQVSNYIFLLLIIVSSYESHLLWCFICLCLCCSRRVWSYVCESSGRPSKRNVHCAVILKSCWTLTSVHLHVSGRAEPTCWTGFHIFQPPRHPSRVSNQILVLIATVFIAFVCPLKVVLSAMYNTYRLCIGRAVLA
jgi:hypothetical protein